MSNDGTSWHSDDELASALERALEIPSEGRGETGEAYGRVEPPAQTASHDFSDLFAALTEPETVAVVAPVIEPEVFTEHEPSTEPEVVIAASVVAQPAEVINVTDAEESASREQIFESLDDFKPRTNFIPVITPEVVAAVDAASSTSIPATSAHVTQPIRWDRKRPSFDEIIFGTSTAETR